MTIIGENKESPKSPAVTPNRPSGLTAPEADGGRDDKAMKALLLQAVEDGKKSMMDQERENRETLFEGATREKCYFGRSSDPDLDEILTKDSDYGIRISEKDFNELEVFVFFYFKHVSFVEDGTRKESITVNGGCYSTTGYGDLLGTHLSFGLSIDDEGTKLKQAVSRPPWQLKQEVIKAESKLGEGAFGSVYKGYLLKAKPRLVAIKISDENKMKVENMLLEAKLMRGLNHGNVIRFYGMTTSQNELTIVMELVEGGLNLVQYIKDNRDKVSTNERTSFCCDISCGLLYLHSIGICHRDLAARNCLIDLKRKRIKISDFGTSRQCEQFRIQKSERTSIRWQAPEIIGNSIVEAVYTKTCDIWSLGITFFEIYSGQKPFDEFEIKEIRVKIQTEEPIFLPKLPKGLPTAIENILMSTWELNPKKRPRARVIAAKSYTYKKSLAKDSTISDKEKKAETDKKKIPVAKTPKKTSGLESPKKRAETPKKISDISKRKKKKAA